MAFTEEERVMNRSMLELSIKELQSGRPVTDDWEQEHFNFFSRVRRSFVNFMDMYPGNEDEDLRRKLNHAEQLARYQEMHWENTLYMNFPAYLQFLEVLHWIVQYEAQEDDGLGDLINTMSITTN